MNKKNPYSSRQSSQHSTQPFRTNDRELIRSKTAGNGIYRFYRNFLKLHRSRTLREILVACEVPTRFR
jgi:hypothetical protein